jgi:eukaryotic-like serine/threonine-protein kinase
MALRVESSAEPIPGYRLLERLGGGGFGEVWKAEAPGGLHKAIKIIHGDLRGSAVTDHSRLAEQELKALKRVQTIRHPYLLSLERYDVVDGRLVIVMELADCNLWDRFRECRAQGQGGLPRADLLRYMEEAAEVLDMMNNQHQLQHLDIKPQNLFLMYNHVKVADFGLVKDLEGMRAEITGGVTPVYAAPETFDGVVTRFCDQYSLAIVYQELLTGVRPFNGTTLQQLLMQHLQGSPNLTPLPLSDRGPIARALAKKPEDRFPTCLHLVKALQQSGGDAPAGTPSGVALGGARAETPPANWSTIPPLPPAGVRPLPQPAPPMETPRTQVGFRSIEVASQPISAPAEQAAPAPIRPAPPEVRGNGALLPAVIVGLGREGGEVLGTFRRQVVDRFGPFERISNLRLIYIDTDPTALQAATNHSSRIALAPSEVIPARLNRPGHYLKPRRNGRSLIEGWFDPQMLYRIPRNPETLGIRSLGRLAFCDHYRLIANRLREALDAATAPDALEQADRHTQLGLRTNRPRVYIVAGLGGGTGGGMFLDMAYAARHRLRLLGYENAEVIGLCLVPPAESGPQYTASLSNCYAALKELNHFSLPEKTFAASFDDRDSYVHDSGPPFTRLYLLSLPPWGPGTALTGAPGSRETHRQAAEFLRRELMSLVGRSADDAREQRSQQRPPGLCVHTFGCRSFTWPRQAVLTVASRWLGEVMLGHWTGAAPEPLRDAVRAYLSQNWEAEELGPEALIAALQKACEKAINQSPDALFTAEAEPFMPRGWFGREPEPAKLWQSLARLQQLVGMPDERSMQRQVGQWEYVLNEAAEVQLRETGTRVNRLIVTLLENPDFRLAGAEEAVTQIQANLRQLLAHYEQLASDLTTKSIEAHALIHDYLTEEKGRRKPTVADVAESIRLYPKWRYQGLLLRQVCRIYLTVCGQLGDQLREIRYCRQRLQELKDRLHNLPVETSTESEGQLLPPGCTSIEAAADALKRQITADDFQALDRQLQAQIELEFHGLFSMCMTSVNMLSNLQSLVEEQARAFLSARLGEGDLVEMFLGKFGDPDRAARALRLAYDEAAPTLIKPSSEDWGEVCLLALPPGEAGEPFHHVSRKALTKREIDLAPSANEILLQREYTRLPLTAVPQSGPLAENAYTQALYANAAPPHTRTDVGEWAEIAAD